MAHPQILQLNQSGTPVRWIGYEDAAAYYAKDQVSWELGHEDFFTLYGGMNRMGIQSTMQVRPIIAIKKLAASGNAEKVRMVPRLTNQNLFNRDASTCAYCCNVPHRELLTRDHVTPKAQGGKDIWMNVVTSCKGCNNRKGPFTPEEAGMELHYAPYIPNHAEFLILSNRKILSSQKDFLRPLINPNSRVFASLAA